jgi:hypothetical protein
VSVGSDPFGNDHEAERLRAFAQERALIVRLAHMSNPALTSEALLEQMQWHEALEALRTRWHTDADQHDPGDPAPTDG